MVQGLNSGLMLWVCGFASRIRGFGTRCLGSRVLEGGVAALASALAMLHACSGAARILPVLRRKRVSEVPYIFYPGLYRTNANPQTANQSMHLLLHSPPTTSKVWPARRTLKSTLFALDVQLTMYGAS